MYFVRRVFRIMEENKDEKEKEVRKEEEEEKD